MVTQSETHDRTNQAGDVFEAGCYPQIFLWEKIKRERNQAFGWESHWDIIGQYYVYICNIP